MKTAALPSLRVEPELREAVESVLGEGETLSSFIEEAVRDGVQRRRARAQFIARGLASRDEATRTGVYHSTPAIRAEMQRMLATAKSRGKP